MNTLECASLRLPSTVRLQQRFNRAASSYHQHALIQKEMIHTLLHLATPTLKTAPSLALDIGCGNLLLGSLLQSLRPTCQLIGLDLAYEMLTFNLAQTMRINADFHHMPFQSEIFDHVWSTSALHWAQDLHQVFAECARLLKPQGYMYLSTFIEGTLREIQDTWIKVDGSPHTLTFRSAQDYIHALKEKGFQLIHQETQSFSIDFNSPREVLHSLKRIGSSVAPATSHLISPLRLKQFEAEYWSQYGSPSHTVPVSYETVFFILKKDGPS